MGLLSGGAEEVVGASHQEDQNLHRHLPHVLGTLCDHQLGSPCVFVFCDAHLTFSASATLYYSLFLEDMVLCLVFAVPSARNTVSIDTHVAFCCTFFKISVHMLLL